MRHRFEHPWMHGHHLIYGQHWGYSWWPGMLLSVLTTVFLVALLIGLAWILLRWILPYILPMIADIFGWPPAEYPPALEVLRQRYAAGEIDAVTFEQMWERLKHPISKRAMASLLIATSIRGERGPATETLFPHL